MTYTFKLSRRLARFRAPMFAALILALTGCSDASSFDPSLPDASDSGPAIDSPLASTTFAGGIPFGWFAQPIEQFGPVYNGAHKTIAPSYLLKDLAAIKARGGKVVLMMAGNERHYKVDGNFSLAKWKSRIDRFKGVNFSSYINDGTIIGHYMIDEPNDPANWGGKPVAPSVLEEMAKYSKQLWPNMATIVRVEPDYLAGNHSYLDAAWAQYLSRKGAPGDFIRRNVSEAQQRGLGLVVGLNPINGGTPNGTPMTPSEIESWGSTLLSSTYPCAFISWQYNAAYLSSSSMRSAMEALRRSAENRSTRTCRGTAGGQTPPPPSPPPPAPTPPPPSSSGLPFGPWGLPASEMGGFSGAVRSVTPDGVLAIAKAARQAGTRVVVRLTSTDVTNSNGTFSLTKWKAALDRYAGVDLSSYVSDGTIVGHLMVLNPEDAKDWGGQRISYATLEEMARYSRQRWPALPTIAHATPAWLDANPAAWQYLDASSVTYAGSAGDAGTWVSKQATAASNARLGLLVAMNVLNGGTSASGLPGTVAGKYAMSASQLKTWGSALLTPSRVCGLVMSRYDAAYFGRSDVKAAVATVADKAAARATTSCRKR